MVDIARDDTATAEQIAQLVALMDRWKGIYKQIAKLDEDHYALADQLAEIKKFDKAVKALEPGVAKAAQFVKATKLIGEKIETIEEILKEAKIIAKKKAKEEAEDEEEKEEDPDAWPENVVCPAKRSRVNKDIVKKIIEIADDRGRNDHGPTVLTDKTRVLHWRLGKVRIFGNYKGGKLEVVGWGTHTGPDNGTYDVELAKNGKSSTAKIPK